MGRQQWKEIEEVRANGLLRFFHLKPSYPGLSRLVPSIHVFELATISKLKAWMAGLPGGQLLRFEQGAGDHCGILDFHTQRDEPGVV